MPRDSICDFVLSITTSTIVWWNKMEKHHLRKESSGKGLRITPTTMQLDIAQEVEDYSLKEWITLRLSCGALRIYPRRTVNFSRLLGAFYFAVESYSFSFSRKYCSEFMVFPSDDLII